MNSNFNNKFDVQNSRFDNNDIKFNEIKCKFDTKFEEQGRQSVSYTHLLWFDNNVGQSSKLLCGFYGTIGNIRKSLYKQ